MPVAAMSAKRLPFDIAPARLTRDVAHIKSARTSIEHAEELTQELNKTKRHRVVSENRRRRLHALARHVAFAHLAFIHPHYLLDIVVPWNSERNLPSAEQAKFVLEGLLHQIKRAQAQSAPKFNAHVLIDYACALTLQTCVDFGVHKPSLGVKSGAVGYLEMILISAGVLGYSRLTMRNRLQRLAKAHAFIAIDAVVAANIRRLRRRAS